MAQPKEKPEFETIAGELRTMIYEQVLIFDHPIVIKSSAFPLKDPSHETSNTRTQNTTALLRVNKKIYAEAQPMLYSRNLFVIGTKLKKGGEDDLHGIDLFLMRVPHNKIAWITNIELFIGRRTTRDEVEKEVGRARDDLDLKHLCQIISKHFTGLQTINVTVDNTFHVDDNEMAKLVGYLEVATRMIRSIDAFRALASINKSVKFVGYYKDIFSCLEGAKILSDELGSDALTA